MHFPSTHWSFVAQLRGADDADKRQLIEDFLIRYLPPMRLYLARRFRNLSEHDREDLLQDFVTDHVIQKSLIELGHRERGRLRGFLCTCLNNFALTRARQLRRHRHGPLDDPAALDRQVGRGAAEDPSWYFDLVWARHLLAEAVSRLRDECFSTGRQLMWEVFDLRVLRPLLTDVRPVPYKDLAARLGATPRHLENLLTSAKRVLERKLRDVVGGYAEGADAIDAEIRDLTEIVSRPHPLSLSWNTDVA